MKEYTLLALVSVFVSMAVDRITKVNLLRRSEFYIYLVVIFGFKLLVNGYLTGTQIVVYNPTFFLGVRFGSIPLEDFFFGFSMVTLSIIFWEYFLRRLR